MIASTSPAQGWYVNCRGLIIGKLGVWGVLELASPLWCERSRLSLCSPPVSQDVLCLGTGMRQDVFQNTGSLRGWRLRLNMYWRTQQSWLAQAFSTHGAADVVPQVNTATGIGSCGTNGVWSTVLTYCIPWSLPWCVHLLSTRWRHRCIYQCYQFHWLQWHCLSTGCFTCVLQKLVGGMQCLLLSSRWSHWFFSSWHLLTRDITSRQFCSFPYLPAAFPPCVLPHL